MHMHVPIRLLDGQMLHCMQEESERGGGGVCSKPITSRVATIHPSIHRSIQLAGRVERKPAVGSWAGGCIEELKREGEGEGARERETKRGTKREIPAILFVGASRHFADQAAHRILAANRHRARTGPLRGACHELAGSQQQLTAI